MQSARLRPPGQAREAGVVRPQSREHMFYLSTGERHNGAHGAPLSLATYPGADCGQSQHASEGAMSTHPVPKRLPVRLVDGIVYAPSVIVERARVRGTGLEARTKPVRPSDMLDVL